MKTDDEILRDASDEAEKHEMVGRVIEELNRAGLKTVAANMLISHIMQRPFPQNPQTLKDLGKFI